MAKAKTDTTKEKKNEMLRNRIKHTLPIIEDDVKNLKEYSEKGIINIEDVEMIELYLHDLHSNISTIRFNIKTIFNR